VQKFQAVPKTVTKVRGNGDAGSRFDGRPSSCFDFGTVEVELAATGRKTQVSWQVLQTHNVPNTRVHTPSNSAGTHFSAGQRLQL
jgi:hypothetical protein